MRTFTVRVRFVPVAMPYMDLLSAAHDVPSVTLDDHVRGTPATAKVTIITYADFACRFCAGHYAMMRSVREQYPDDVAWVFRHFPLPFHVHAMHAALAAESAAGQGRFWDYADRLFAQQYRLEQEPFDDIAKELRLELGRFHADRTHATFAAKVLADLGSGLACGVTGTPTCFVNGKLLYGAIPPRAFHDVVAAEIAQARKAPPTFAK